MRAALIAALVIVPVSASAQVRIDVALPSVHFEIEPPVVVIDPGIEVVVDQPEEIFVVNGFYYCRRGDVWFRARDHRSQWVRIERAEVPPRLVVLTPGKYKHYKGKVAPASYVRHDDDDHDDKHEKKGKGDDKKWKKDKKKGKGKGKD